MESSTPVTDQRAIDAAEATLGVQYEIFRDFLSATATVEPSLAYRLDIDPEDEMEHHLDIFDGPVQIAEVHTAIVVVEEGLAVTGEIHLTLLDVQSGEPKGYRNWAIDDAVRALNRRAF